MFGIFLTAFGALAEEVSNSIGKRDVMDKTQSIFTMGFLQLSGGWLIFLGLALFQKDSWMLSWQTFPFLLLRIILEIVQIHITLLAIVKAERSTFGFIRTLTIPLLLLIEILLGYRPGIFQILGMGIIVFVFSIIFLKHDFSAKGQKIVLCTAINAAFSLTLYKYLLTQNNSVVAQQFIVVTVILVYLLLRAWYEKKESPLRGFTKPKLLVQTGTQTIAFIADSFAYSFAPASIILAAKRSSAVLWAVLSGKNYFKETHSTIKIGIAMVLIIGIIFLMIQ